VFADLGFPDATELGFKVQLAIKVVRLLDARRLSSTAAASVLKTSPPKISALKNYKLDDLSVHELKSFSSFLDVPQGWR
jgi:predicted XRE-type DNA-binding protein